MCFFKFKKSTSKQEQAQKLMEKRLQKIKRFANFFKIDSQITNSEIIVGLDHSGSMSDLYVDGSIQLLFNRIYPLSLVDTKTELSLYAFTEKVKKIRLNNSNFNQCIDSIHFFGWGNSVLSPFINVLEKKINNNKTLVIVFFDDTLEDIETVLSTIKNFKNFFFVFVSIRNEICNNNNYYNTLNTTNSKFISFKTMDDILSLNDLWFYKLLLEPYLHFCRHSTENNNDK